MDHKEICWPWGLALLSLSGTISTPDLRTPQILINISWLQRIWFDWSIARHRLLQHEVDTLICKSQWTAFLAKMQETQSGRRSVGFERKCHCTTYYNMNIHDFVWQQNDDCCNSTVVLQQCCCAASGEGNSVESCLWFCLFIPLLRFSNVFSARLEPCLMCHLCHERPRHFCPFPCSHQVLC